MRISGKSIDLPLDLKISLIFRHFFVNDGLPNINLIGAFLGFKLTKNDDFERYSHHDLLDVSKFLKSHAKC